MTDGRPIGGATCRLVRPKVTLSFTAGHTVAVSGLGQTIVPARIVSDRGRLKQILGNLTGIAAKAGPGERFTLRLPPQPAPSRPIQCPTQSDRLDPEDNVPGPIPPAGPNAARHDLPTSF